MVRLVTYAPAVGLLGLAVYQVLYQHDLAAAASTVSQAGALFGFGISAHAVKSHFGSR